MKGGEGSGLAHTVCSKLRLKGQKEGGRSHFPGFILANSYKVKGRHEVLVRQTSQCPGQEKRWLDMSDDLLNLI